MSEIPPAVMEEIMEAIYKGRKLNAVKIYKESSGKSLLEAKTFIEGLTAELKSTSPEKFDTKSATGCAGLILLLATSFGVAVVVAAKGFSMGN